MRTRSEAKLAAYCLSLPPPPPYLPCLNSVYSSDIPSAPRSTLHSRAQKWKWVDMFWTSFAKMLSCLIIGASSDRRHTSRK